MSFKDDFLDTYKRVLTEPSEFFKSEDKRDGFGFPLKFAAVNIVLSAVLSAIAVGVLGSAGMALGEVTNGASILLISGATLILTPIIGLIGLFISAGIIHIFVSLLGGQNTYSETLSVIEYATAVQPITAIFSFIPLLGDLVNLVIGIYAIFLQTKGIENFQELSTGRALAAVLLPVVIIIGIVLTLVVLAVAGTLAGISAA